MLMCADEQCLETLHQSAFAQPAKLKEINTEVHCQKLIMKNASHLNIIGIVQNSRK